MNIRETLENWLEENLYTEGYHEKFEPFERTLLGLSTDCDGEIKREAERYLEFLKENYDPDDELDEEFHFSILLSLMVQRKQTGALDLLKRAMNSGVVEFKNAYLDLLQNFDGSEIEKVMLSVLPAWASYDEYGGEEIVRVIEQLGELKSSEAESFIYTRIEDESFKVRKAAIHFLDKYAQQKHCAPLVKQLGVEEYPDIMVELATLAAKWGCQDAKPPIQKYIRGDWHGSVDQTVANQLRKILLTF